MKDKVVLTLLTISLGANIYMFGKQIIFDRLYEPTPDEKVLLSEMVQKTIESEDYKKIAKKEKVIAIDTSVDKNTGGVFPYYMEVSVRTDKQTNIFSCSDKKCSTMENGAWTYSIYQDEKPRLPFKGL